MQLSFTNSRRSGERAPSTLVDLREGEQGVVEDLDLPADVSRRLMELGFLPGSRITAARSAPGGDPRVFRVDGSEVALRRETATHIKLRAPSSHHR
jgi:ferrous iron transport protein A